MPPSEYWAASPAEVWALINAWTPEKRYGNMTESQLDELEDSRSEWEKRGFNLI